MQHFNSSARLLKNGSFAPNTFLPICFSPEVTTFNSQDSCHVPPPVSVKYCFSMWQCECNLLASHYGRWRFSFFDDCSFLNICWWKHCVPPIHHKFGKGPEMVCQKQNMELRLPKSGQEKTVSQWSVANEDVGAKTTPVKDAWLHHMVYSTRQRISRKVVCWWSV